MRFFSADPARFGPDARAAHLYHLLRSDIKEAPEGAIEARVEGLWQRATLVNAFSSGAQVLMPGEKTLRNVSLEDVRLASDAKHEEILPNASNSLDKVPPTQYSERNGRIVVELSEIDEKRARKIAEGRNSKEGRFGAMTYTGKDSFSVHLEGARAEVAVASYYDAPVDEAIHEASGDAGVDLVIFGKRAQVKATTYSDEPYLRVECHKTRAIEGCDVFFCCVSAAESGSPVQIVGFATREEVKAAPRKRFGKARHENHVLYEHELRRCKPRRTAA